MRAIGWFSMLSLAFGCAAGQAVHPVSARAEPPSAPAPKAPKAAPAPSGPVCTLANPEVPRGGRLELKGERFGQAPVVRIAGKTARILERRDDKISVQVAADSDGGAVTLQADGKTADCGTLVIIGKNG